MMLLTYTARGFEVQHLDVLRGLLEGL